MKAAFRNPFAAALIAAATLTASTFAQTTLLTDNFDTVTSFTADPNADQAGILAPATYTVGAPFGGTSYQRRGTGVLELGYDGTTASGGSRVFTAANYIAAANALNSPIRITFEINAANTDWVGLVVGTTDAWLDANGSLTEFSALFRNDGTGNKWVNGGNQGALATDTSSLITLELSNTDGTGSPFNGTGSVAKLTRGTTDLGTYTLDQLTATNGKFAFCTYNGNLGAGGTVDNLTITATSTSTTPNRWSGAVDGNWDESTANFTGGSFSAIKTNGATSAMFGDVSGALAPVTNSDLTIATAGVQIDDVIFDNNTVAYSLASGGVTGITGYTNLAKTGSGTLTVGNVNTYSGATIVSGGELVLSGGANRLPVTTELTLTSPGVLRLGGNNQEVAYLASSGRVVNGDTTLATLTVNNGYFTGNIGGTGTDENNLALVKTGPDQLNLTAANTFTGGTTIEEGTLVLGYGAPTATLSSVGPLASTTTVTINSDGVLTGGANNNWLGITGVSSGGANAPTVIVNTGGTLRGGGGTISGLGNVTLNGGTLEVVNGYGQWGWNACFNLGGDITVSGDTPAAITTAPEGGGNAVIYLANGSNGTGGTRSIIVEDVTVSAASDLVLSARLAKGTVIKDGPGTLEIAAGETGTEAPASWQINAGSFVLANGATFEFRLTNSASNNVIEASGGDGSAAFNGALNIDTTAVTATTGTWPLIDVAGLSAIYGASFAVTGFTLQPDGYTWTKTSGANKFSFDQTTGTLTLAPAASDYDSWSGTGGYNLSQGPTGDDDGDGLTNQQEYAFGLIPNNGSSCNPIIATLDKTNGTLTYTRRDPAKTAMTYTVLKSETLASESWTGLVKDTDYQESVLSTLNDVQTVRVTLTPAPTVPKLFIRIKAD